MTLCCGLVHVLVMCPHDVGVVVVEAWAWLDVGLLLDTSCALLCIKFTLRPLQKTSEQHKHVTRLRRVLPRLHVYFKGWHSSTCWYKGQCVSNVGINMTTSCESQAHYFGQHIEGSSSSTTSQPEKSTYPSTDRRRTDIYNEHGASTHDHAQHDAALQQSNMTPDELSPALVRNGATSTDFDMLPPLSSTHPSWQALHDYAQHHASEHGYALSINTTAKNRSRIKLTCVCYGQPKNTHKLTPETRVRKNRSSYKTGCKMWIEGKKQEDGTWLLRVGEPQHNHAGRASAAWAVQRKRTWGVAGGRIGVGGVTAKEELACGDSHAGESEAAQELPSTTVDRLEQGGQVWKIVEQEMLHKSEPGQGRDRGVGRTVEVLRARLPGIHIFKRDVYNIRAQIKRARKAAGQQIGEGLDDSEDEDERVDAGEKNEADAFRDHHAEPLDLHIHGDKQYAPMVPVLDMASQIDPTLAAQHGIQSTRTAVATLAPAGEVDRLRRENAELRMLLTDKTTEIEEQTIEIASLRSQLGFMSILARSCGGSAMAG